MRWLHKCANLGQNCGHGWDGAVLVLLSSAVVEKMLCSWVGAVVKTSRGWKRWGTTTMVVERVSRWTLHVGTNNEEGCW